MFAFVDKNRNVTFARLPECKSDSGGEHEFINRCA